MTNSAGDLVTAVSDSRKNTPCRATALRIVFNCPVYSQTIDKLVYPDGEDKFDGTHIWVHLSREVDWATEGCGFIYRNFRGSKKTLGEALESLYSVLYFCGGPWKLEQSQENCISYVSKNSRELIVRYNLDGPTIFDMNH